MKPCVLEMTAFGPYRTFTRIAFDAFDGKGVFLIHGATGAGKSTLLDAICFALYGEAASPERDPRSLRSSGAPSDVLTSVALELELDGERYRVERTPPYDREKKRGAGTTSIGSTAVVYRLLADGSREPIAASTSEADRVLAQKLKLDAVQFRQVVVLPQGQFRDFLIAASGDRQRILESLFDISAYRQLEERLDAHRASVEGIQRARETDRRAALMQHEVESESALAEKHMLATTKLIEMQARLASVRDEVENARAAHATAKNTFDRCVERERLSKRKSALLTEEPLIERTRAEVEAANRAAIVAAHDQALRVRERKESELKKATAKLEADLKTASSAYETACAASARNRDDAEELVDAPYRIAKLEHRLPEVQRQIAAIALRSQLEATAREAANASASLDATASRLETELGRLRDVRVASENETVLLLARFDDRAMKHSLATTLREGQACPVCGSTAHPNPYSTLPPLSIDELLSKAAEADVARQAIDAKRGEIEAQLIALREKREAARSRTENARRAASENTREQLASDEELVLERETIERELSQLRSRTEAVRAASRTCAEAERIAERTLAELRGELSNKEALLQATKRGAVDMEKELQRAVRAQGFAGALEFRAAQRDTVKLAALSQAVAAFDRNLAEIEGQLAIAGSAEPIEDARGRCEAAAAALERISSEQESLAVEAGLLASAIGRMQDSLHAIAKTELDSPDNTALLRLTALAGGQNTLAISFSRYALSLFFDEVLLVAGSQLRTLSGGRYDLHRSLSRTDLRRSSGLDISVFDHSSGTSRPASSLSGGESFLAALALAMGLSEVQIRHSGGRTCDALFIDEGFGSLDEHALDQALEALSKLERRGRLIGIVSHVAELRERIAHRLEVSLDAQGNARARVCSPEA